MARRTRPRPLNPAERTVRGRPETSHDDAILDAQPVRPRTTRAIRKAPARSRPTLESLEGRWAAADYPAPRTPSSDPVTVTAATNRAHGILGLAGLGFVCLFLEGAMADWAGLLAASR
jgi:hypothetical protein